MLKELARRVRETFRINPRGVDKVREVLLTSDPERLIPPLAILDKRDDQVDDFPWGEWVARVTTIILDEEPQMKLPFLRELAKLDVHHQALVAHRLWVHGWENAGRRRAIPEMIRLLEKKPAGLPAGESELVRSFKTLMEPLRTLEDGQESPPVAELLEKLPPW